MLQNQEFRFNEVLFEHRNKEYGAYALRNESGRILTKALFAGAALMAAISLTPLAIKALSSSDPESAITQHLGPYILHQVPEAIPPVTVPVQQQTQPPKVKTTDDRLPEPTARITNEKAVEKIQGAVSGIRNNSEGETAPADTYVPQVPAVSTGPVSMIPLPKVETKTDNPDVIPTVVDVEASFPGGVNAFRNKVMNSFDSSGMEADEVMKTTVTFIVERDGSISGLKADGKNADFNREALRTIRAIQGKWIPAKVKGQPVRSYFRFPMTMRLDNL